MRTTGSTRSSRRLAGTLLLAAVAVAGCAARVDPPSAVTDSPPTEQVKDLARDAQLSAATDGTPMDQAALTDQRNRDMMRFVAQCMAERGFDYTPVDLPPSAPHLNGQRLSEADFAATLGYGISTDIDGGLSTRLFPNEAIDDPNIERRAMMPAKKRLAYDGALTDCGGRANTEIPLPPGSIIVPPGHEDELDELNQLVDAHPRVVDGTRTWSHCMAERGYTYASEADIHASLEAKAAPLKGAYETRGGPRVSADADVESSVDEVLTAAEQSTLTSLQTYERNVAVADYECGADLVKIRAAVMDEFIAEIVDDASG